MLSRPTMSGDPSKNLTMSQSSNSNEENACQRLQFGVVQFPGSNSDQDCIHAVESMGHEARYIWHKDTDLGGVHAVLVPGGFSYGDYLVAGAIARLSPVMHAVAQFAEAGGLVMGICNGFQILCEAGLLPGALIRNRSHCNFVRNSSISRSCMTNRPSLNALRMEPFCAFPLLTERVATMPTKRPWLRWRTIVRFYGNTPPHRVTLRSMPIQMVSVQHIAGVCSREGNVAGLMPHPERACQQIIGSDDGQHVFRSIIQHLTQTH